MTSAVIAILGIGNMGRSLLEGLIKNGHPADALWAADPSEEKLKHIQQLFPIHTTQDNQQATQAADVIIFAVKPQVFAQVASPLSTVIQQRTPLVISIAAGVREKQIQQWLGGNIAIVRTMPNTPALIGCGATALYANPFVSHDQQNLAESILRAVGITVWLKDESLLDTVTALSGSGPAYFFMMMEALQQAAEELGLPSDIARLLTLQTALGASRLALETDIPLAILRQQVTSPGGTTEKALLVLEEHKVHQAFKHALQAAKTHSEKLSNHS